jgi:hypothetical protein
MSSLLTAVPVIEESPPTQAHASVNNRGVLAQFPDAELAPSREGVTRTRGAKEAWIAQLGQGRGGFYSYDLLENLVGCDIHSADRIVPEWQDVGAGAQVRFAPKVSLSVAFVEQG